MDPTSFVVNGRTYVMPAAPVVICIDGSELDYHVAAWGVRRQGQLVAAHCTLPALTNPNNLGSTWPS